MLAVSDSSALILLSHVNRLELLRDTFHRVIVPPAVIHEVVNDSLNRAGAAEVAAASWIHVERPNNARCVLSPGNSLGPGETEVIALAAEMDGDVFAILDNRPARLLARRLGLRVVGTAGVLVFAKQQNVIESIGPILSDLLQAGMHLGGAEIHAILRLADELPPTHP